MRLYSQQKVNYKVLVYNTLPKTNAEKSGQIVRHIYKKITVILFPT